MIIILEVSIHIMKNTFFLSIFLLLCSCNSNKDTARVRCANRGDLFYMGYTGKVKKIIETGAETNETWNLQQLPAYIVTVSEFDTAGFLVNKTQSVVMNGDERIISSIHYGGHHPRVAVADNNEVIDTIMWAGNTNTISKYHKTGDSYNLYMHAVYNYDTACMLASSVESYYDISGLVKKDSFNVASLTPQQLSLRKQYGHASIFYQGKMKIVEKDATGNIVKLEVPNENHIRKVLQYEYYE